MANRISLVWGQFLVQIKHLLFSCNKDTKAARVCKGQIYEVFFYTYYMI